MKSLVEDHFFNLREFSTMMKVTSNFEKYSGIDIVKFIKASHIRWLGHKFRYAEEPKRITISRIDEIRRKSRPPTRWNDDVEKDLKSFNKESTDEEHCTD